ncbi:MAG: pantoate--beta-alanine ligase, partial [Gammaproteobacteria bacterium]|nr:pantoate--beta-alanine ligase [Gammaproteobacteria bacterium]MBT4192757.1 pantoate--beta-alanine ligase [Gammaproteobacteria bacterium]MBT4448248.1 pantoate--beta-alanine ligase [Gammaproteobacteria bacterium]MBT4862042.1 pantoate--beta-alanine ligase [Gammaproteobacteria bacterium]MBT6550649.1 pantoate--beta-alanine ligase [Gammaproteobacteria bacterium]
MLQVHNNNELSAQIRDWKRQGHRIAFVPTMGNLHQGHLSLLRLGHEQADKLISSIFVNPMQFSPNEDLNNYPRTLEQDCKALMEHQCDLVYLPTEQDLYPNGLEHMTTVHVMDITQRFEGEFRPGHLTGVSTIVLKLFNLVQPDIAVFGKKDYQQLQMIKKMVKDLNLNIDIIGGETVRDESGIAMSSRNQYLTEDQQPIATKLQQQLSRVAEEIRKGNKSFSALTKEATDFLNQSGFEVDYFDICHQQTLKPANDK